MKTKLFWFRTREAWHRYSHLQNPKTFTLFCSSVNLIGFTVVSDWGLGATIIALTDAMECITKSLR